MADRPLLITGATGFVGRHLVETLLSYCPASELRLLVRDRSRALASGLPAESLCAGDLRDPASLESAVGGVGAVVHLAGVLKALRAREFDEGNRVATANLVAAVQRGAAGIRVVHVSSISAAGPSRDGSGTDAAPEHCHPCSVYGRSKLDGERELVRAGAGLRWIVLRPPLVYGPRDEATRLLFRQVRMPLVAVPWRPRPLSLIHVSDLVAAIRLALAAEAQHCFVPLEGPERVDTSGFVRAMGAALNRRPWVLPIPLVLARGAAWCADLWAALTRRASFFSFDKVREIAAPGWIVDPRPARDLLGFHPSVPLAQGLAEVVAAERAADS